MAVKHNETPLYILRTFKHLPNTVLFFARKAPNASKANHKAAPLNDRIENASC